MSAEAPRARVALALGTVYLVWGSTYLAIRWAVAELPPFTAGAVRFVTAGGLFLLFGLVRGAPRPSRRQVRNAALIGVALLGVSNGLVGFAEQRLSSSLAALVLAITPLWIALFEAIRPGGARPSRAAVVGLLIGFCGTGWLVYQPNARGDAAGLFIVLVASITWATGSLAARRASRPSAFTISAGTEMLAGGLAQLLIAVVRGEPARLTHASPGPRAIGALVYLIVIGAWAGYGAFSWLTRNARPTLVATYAYVNPLVAVTLGALLAGEPLSSRVLVAGAAVVVSVVLVTRQRVTAPAPPPDPPRPPAIR